MSGEENHSCTHHNEAALSRRLVLGSAAAMGTMAAFGEGAGGAAAAATIPAAGFAAPGESQPLVPFSFKRRPVGPKDVLIDILYCGVCHSDIHTVNGDWPGTVYPCVPGHEILGRVVKVGGEVTKFKRGDIAAVGCMVDSCGHCEACTEGLEQYCPDWTLTYDSNDKISGGKTYGGYSSLIVVTEHFAVKIPPGMNLSGATPLLCAGITTYSPLRHWKAGPGKKVGIVGIGGLGHVGVKISAALGAETYAITTTPDKAVDAKRLGAVGAILSTDATAMGGYREKFDLLVSTIPCNHDVHPYLNLLKRDGTLVIVGALAPKPGALAFAVLVARRRSIAGSCIGGMAETQEMVDFCARHAIVTDAEIIPIQKINEAYKNVENKKVRYRYVIDMASLRKA
jgi:alcohol dehydrogenase (NADP+)